MITINIYEGFHGDKTNFELAKTYFDKNDISYSIDVRSIGGDKHLVMKSNLSWEQIKKLQKETELDIRCMA